MTVFPLIHLIGLPTDRNSSFLRGTAEAPCHIRQRLFSEVGNSSTESGLDIGREIRLQDLGDLPLREEDADDRLIEAAVKRSSEEGAVPLLLGGDHSVTFPIVKALAELHGPLQILHFDAHPDLYDELDGNRRSHASPFARIMEIPAASRVVQVGIRTLNLHQRQQALRFGVEIIEMRNFKLEAIPLLNGPLYISIDLDGIDPAHAPGVSHQEPGGLTVREVLTIIQRQTARIIGADIVELNPSQDVGDMTAAVAAKLAKELCARICENAVDIQ